ncbi:MAG: hypothetical protein KDB56_18120 [Mycobacterium sp.]|nr:hypothetical protein [Mycobacterium sp.]
MTETPEVAGALDGAAGLRRAAVLASAGRYADAFGARYLDELRTDWPA